MAIIPRRDVLRDNQTERERLLHVICIALLHSSSRYEPPSGDWMVHAAKYKSLAVGDLVYGTSAGEIGWIYEIHQEPNKPPIYSVKTLGRNHLVTWNNEDFCVIVGIDKEHLREGREYQFKEFVHDAIETHPKNRHLWGYYRCEFNGDNAIVEFRERVYNRSFTAEVPNYASFLEGDLDRNRERLYTILAANGWGGSIR